MQTLIEKLEVLLEAAKTGKTVQWLSSDGEWKDDGQDYDSALKRIQSFNDRRLKPTRKLRPWKLEEVPLEGWFRTKGFETAKRIAMVQQEVNTPITIHHPMTLMELLLHVEWTLTPFDSQSWKPCGV